MINELPQAWWGTDIAQGVCGAIKENDAMKRPLLNATREAVIGIWRALCARFAEPPAAGTGGAIG
jgi:hypothetical protein